MPRIKTKALPKRAVVLALQVQFGVSRKGVPHVSRLRNWAEAAYLAYVQGHRGKGSRVRAPLAEVSLRVVGAVESRKLNRDWRDQDHATNVLSFPAGDVLTPDTETYSLGDLAICVPVVAREAKQQHKQTDAHWAHLMVHGVLHLLGYDHENDRDAMVMETTETAVLAQFGFANPYE